MSSTLCDIIAVPGFTSFSLLFRCGFHPGFMNKLESSLMYICFLALLFLILTVLYLSEWWFLALVPSLIYLFIQFIEVVKDES